MHAAQFSLMTASLDLLGTCACTRALRPQEMAVLFQLYCWQLTQVSTNSKLAGMRKLKKFHSPTSTTHKWPNDPDHPQPCELFKQRTISSCAAVIMRLGPRIKMCRCPHLRSESAADTPPEMASMQAATCGNHWFSPRVTRLQNLTMQIAATPIVCHVCLCLEKQWTLWTRTNCMRARVFLSVLATAISFPNRFWFHPGACVVLLVWCAQFNNPEQPFTGSKLAKCHASSTNLSETSHCFFLFSSSSHVENLRWISILRHSKVTGWCVRQDCMQNKQLCCLADLLFLTALHCRTTFGAAMGLANTTYLLPSYIFLPTSRRVVAIAMEVIKGHQRSEWLPSPRCRGSKSTSTAFRCSDRLLVDHFCAAENCKSPESVHQFLQRHLDEKAHLTNRS